MLHVVSFYCACVCIIFMFLLSSFLLTITFVYFVTVIIIILMNNTMNRRKVFRSLLCPDGILAAYAATYIHNEYLTEYKLCSVNNALLTYGQLEACRKVITRIVKRQKPKGFFIQIGKVYLPFTQKSKNARMGRGKGIHGVNKIPHV